MDIITKLSDIDKDFRDMNTPNTVRLLSALKKLPDKRMTVFELESLLEYYLNKVKRGEIGGERN